MAPLLSSGAVVLLASVALHFRDPHEAGTWGVCPTAVLLGLDCPACGSLRAVHDLTNLDLVSAASSNLLFVLLAPLVVGAWSVRVLAAWRAEPPKPNLRAASGPLFWSAFLTMVAAFTIVRNLPVGHWLHS
ncbi:MAG: DUF2752 domain-containing protein [Nocardioides sp.]